MEIKKYRKSTGLTQKQFSELFEIPVDVVKSWDSGRRTPPFWVEKLIIEKLERMEKIMESLLKEELKKREIEIESEINFAGNSIRYFIFKGQKIDFDSQRLNGTTYFGWEKEEIENLILVIDNISDDYGIYLESPCGIELYFTWGMMERLCDVNFSGFWHIVKGKICHKVG